MNIKKLTASTIITVLAVLLAFLFISNCKGTIIRTLGGYTEVNTITEIDTTYLPVEIDTLEVFNAWVKSKGIILNAEPVIKYKYRNTPTSPAIDSVKQFTADITDSLIQGTALVTNRFDGDLVGLELNYRPLFPKIIEKRIPYEITKTITRTISNDKNRFGVGVGINSEVQGSVHGAYITKKNWGIMIEYERPITDDVIPENVGVKLTKYF